MEILQKPAVYPTQTKHITRPDQGEGEEQHLLTLTSSWFMRTWSFMAPSSTSLWPAARLEIHSMTRTQMDCQTQGNLHLVLRQFSRTPRDLLPLRLVISYFHSISQQVPQNGKVATTATFDSSQILHM